MALTKVTTGGITDATIATADIAADAITGAKIADDAINSEHYTDGSIDTAHIAADQITGAKIADDAVGAEHIEVLDADLQMTDAGKIKLGTGNDLEVFHSGSNSQIVHNGTGALYLDSIGSSVNIRAGDNAGGVHNSIVCSLDAGVELFFNNSAKVETRADDTIFHDDIVIQDNNKIKIGTSDDLQIYHDGSTNIIDGQFHPIELRHQSEVHVKCTDDGAVELYHDNTKKFETVAGGVKTNDNNYMGFGNGNDLQIYHDGSHSYANNTTGFFHIRSGSDIRLQSSSGEPMIYCIPDGAVELYHNNNKRFYTEQEGASVLGDGNDCHFRLRDSSNNVRGIVHATASVDVGFITADATAWLFRVHDDGSYQHYGSEISDRDKKDNITTISSTSLDKVTKLVPKTFTFKQDETGKVPTDKVFTGFIAQEVKEHLPNIVTGTDGQKDMAVDYNGILAHAVKAITELSAEVETLKTKVAALEAA